MKTTYDKITDAMFVTYSDSKMMIAFDSGDPDMIYHYDPEKKEVVGITIYGFSEKVEIDYDLIYRDANNPSKLKYFNDISMKRRLEDKN